jgi:peptidoglycan-N-acetylglucosamine deacetylase
MGGKIIITTSWDDGYFLDGRIADLLNKHNMKGTFYVPIRNSEHSVMDNNLLLEIATNFEIGGHTVNHTYLNSLGVEDAEYEISTCKKMLENKLGKDISAFCFPGGKYSKRDVELVQNAGFLFGRTTSLFHASLNNTMPLMDTTIQCFNHDFLTLTKHCLKRNYISPILKHNFFIPYSKSFGKLITDIIPEIHNSGGCFHFWGHSWEIDKYGLWNDLVDIFKIFNNETDALFLSNTEYWQFKQKLNN